jgi:hypothetical protein
MKVAENSQPTEVNNQLEEIDLGQEDPDEAKLVLP